MDAVKSYIYGMTVLVTGGAGSIGSEICRQVLDDGCKKLIILDFNENGLFEIDNEITAKYGKERHETILGSIRELNRLEEVFSKFKPDVVFHAAAHKHVPMMEWNPLEAIKNNVFGTLNVAKVADKHNVKKFILISTDKAVNPPNIMGATKRIAELCLQMMDVNSKTEFAAVRFGNVLGSNGSVVPIFKQQIAQGGPITVTHPDIKRYFMTITEAVQLVLQAGAMASGGEIFVLDMGKPVKILDLAKTLVQLSGLEPDKDIRIEFTGLRSGEKLFEEINLSDEEVSRTENNKIFILKHGEHNYIKISHQIRTLYRQLHSSNPEMAFQTIHDMVPTYEFNHDSDKDVAIIERFNSANPS
jgi:FlaA1/EpsC-like NDP-sugar epimerase